MKTNECGETIFEAATQAEIDNAKRDDHCTHPNQAHCDCDWCRLLANHDRDQRMKELQAIQDNVYALCDLKAEFERQGMSGVDPYQYFPGGVE